MHRSHFGKNSIGNVKYLIIYRGVCIVVLSNFQPDSSIKPPARMANSGLDSSEGRTTYVGLSGEWLVRR